MPFFACCRISIRRLAQRRRRSRTEATEHRSSNSDLISGFIRADAGSVQAFGRELVGLRPHEVCGFGLVRTFQVAKPFGAMSVLDNVTTIVIVEHVMRAIMAVAHHMVVLDHGQKIAEGAPDDIVRNPEVIRAYLGSGFVHAPAEDAA